MECPTSYITADSLAFLDEYRAWKMSGNPAVVHYAARSVDAFVLLDHLANQEKIRALERR